MRYLLLILILLSPIVSEASTLSEELKMHADTTPREIRTNHIKVSAYLSSVCQNEEDKVNIFAYWIAKNIKYNLKEKKANGRNKIAREVITSRSAVCGGISRLFWQMCKNEGILCFYVTGYAYGKFFENHFAKEKKLAHAWNAVYCDKEWGLVDVTWTINDLPTKKFKDTRVMNHVLTNPHTFARDHYPHDPRWQMQKDPVTYKEFWKRKDLENRVYHYEDSLKVLLDTHWVEARKISIKGEFIESQDEEGYIENLLMLGWDLVGGAYDSLETVQAISVFDHTLNEHERFVPYKSHKEHLQLIGTGKWLCKKRLEMKE